ncbi:MAG TPA: hypothetical protein VHW04_15970, partial [Solirubrobacteraceae bacterium]|nr:hypothetical protein [Solirubrobacteraceae bacterium]
MIAKRTAIPLSPVLLAIAVAWGVFASPAVAAPGLSSAKHSVKAGGAVRLTGGGWGCSRDVTLTAYVDGVSPYGTLRIGQARVGHGGFAGRWTTPRLTDTLPWIVQGVQRCGRRTAVATTAIT